MGLTLVKVEEQIETANTKESGHKGSLPPTEWSGWLGVTRPIECEEIQERPEFPNWLRESSLQGGGDPEWRGSLRGTNPGE